MAPLICSIVVRLEEFGDLKVLCFTETGSPAVYCDSGYAELRCSQLRDMHPDYKFAVIDSPVL